MEPGWRLTRVMRVDYEPTEPANVAELYSRAYGPLVGLLTSIGGSAGDAEEVAQDAFVKLLGHWERVRSYDDPEAWVRMVAVRLLISRHRRTRVAALGVLRLSRRPATVQSDVTAVNLDVARALGSLPMPHRAVLMLHHGLDLPVETVARELQIPVGTVKSRLSRGRAALAPLLREPEELLRNG
jgi:RNA polymerase sigma-70 factor (ECF subfamily)